MNSLNDQRLLNISYGIEARVNNLLDERLLESLASKRLWLIQTGVECGYQSGIEKVNKKTTLERVRTVARLAKKYDLSKPMMFSFIIGLPWESKEDCLNTIHFAAELADEFDTRSNISWHALLPSTLWDGRKEYGIDCNEDVFNNDGWFVSGEYFNSCRPKISDEEYQELESIVVKYCNSGIPIRGDWSSPYRGKPSNPFHKK
jgi:hypothetical protein